MRIQAVLLHGFDPLGVIASCEVLHAPRGEQRHRRAGATPVGTVRPELEEVIPS